MLKIFKKLTLLYLLLFCASSDAQELLYEHLTDGHSYSVHILIVDPTKNTILPVRANGRETVATLAQRNEALAAVNGGFWKLSGEPAGILKIDGAWQGMSTKPRGAIGWSSKGGQVIIDQVLTSLDSIEIEVIPASAPPHTTPSDWEPLDHIVGGTPVLIREGTLIEDYSSEQVLDSFLHGKHARTAVGIRDNGDWVFAVVDRHLGGMTIRELAELMLMLGCKEALNLDGGGSSTMVLDNTVINTPCGKVPQDDKWVNGVSDAILILPGNFS